MMKKLLLTLALCASTSVFAAATVPTTIDVSKLSPEQVRQIQSQVSELNKDPSNVSATVRKEAEAWGELGANMGKAMVGAAKEVGVAADQFSQTSLGKIVVAIVAYKVVGRDVLGIAVGSIILLVGWSIGIYLLVTRRFADIKYEYVPVLKGLFTRKRVVSVVQPEDSVGGRIVACVAMLMLTTLVGLAVIF